MTVCPIGLGICPVWAESSLCTQWVAKDPNFLQVDSKDSDQTGRMPRLIWVFAGRTCRFVCFVMMRLILVDLKSVLYPKLNELRHVKTCLRGFRPGKTQTGLSATENSYRLEILDIKTRGIILSKQQITKALIRLYRYAADPCHCRSHMPKTGFLVTWLKQL